MIVPITAFCQNVFTPSRFMPLSTSARMIEPTAVPNAAHTAEQRRAAEADRRDRRQQLLAEPESAAFMRAITISAANPANSPLKP